jgi:hypothetical protein
LDINYQVHNFLQYHINFYQGSLYTATDAYNPFIQKGDTKKKTDESFTEQSPGLKPSKDKAKGETAKPILKSSSKPSTLK